VARQALGVSGMAAEKRRSIIEAATEVFLREGFTRASIDVIAATAGVSKRTVYNHYTDKQALFLSVIEQVNAPVIARFAEIAERHLRNVTDLERDLIAFGRDWVRLSVLLPQHGAVLRLMIAEATHFPDAVETWYRNGAAQSRSMLTEHLSRLTDEGLLDVPDADEAARHLTALICGPPQSLSFFGTRPVADSSIDELVTSGARAFLRIYPPPSADLADQGARRDRGAD
jgi:AcrR family transcriptional regulator